MSTSLHTQPAARPAETPLRNLFATLPDAYATMQTPGSGPKYQRVKNGTLSIPLTANALRQHLTGAITIACALEDTDGMARVAVADIDHGGAEAVQLVQAEARRRGYAAFAFISKGAGDHDGGYVWIVFAEPYAAERMQALMANICTAVQVKAEYRTTRSDTRLPFGWHRHSRTYGTMHAPDGTSYDLDETDQRRAALRLFSRTTNHQAPPEVQAPERTARPQSQPMPSAASCMDLADLLQRGNDLAERLRGWLDPVTRAALRDELYSQVNPAIIAAVPAAFNSRFTCGEILERHGACLERTRGIKQYYGALPGDVHSDPEGIKYCVDTAKDHCHSFTESGRIPKIKGDRDAFALFTDLDHGGNTRSAQIAAAALLAPVPRSHVVHAASPVPMPTAPPGPTDDQRRAWREAKAQQRAQHRNQAATIHAAIMERANNDPQLLDTKGNGNIAFVVLLVLLDIADNRTWCRPSVPLIAATLDCCVGHVRRGLAILEGRYITTERQVNTETGEIWSGGRHGETPKRTFLAVPLHSVPALQTEETGRSSIFDDDRHDHVTNTTCLEESNRQRGAVLPPAAPTAPTAGELERAPEAEPVAIDGGASYNPAAALPPAARPYTGRSKAYLSPRAEWAAVDAAHAEYERTHPQPAPVDQAAEPQQQPLLDDAPKPKRRRTRSNDPRKLEGQIIALERKAANIARTNPKQAWALRHQADATRSELSMLAERGDAERETTDPAPVEVPQDRPALSVTFDEPTPRYVAMGTLADLRAAARAQNAAIRARVEQERTHAA